MQLQAAQYVRNFKFAGASGKLSQRSGILIRARPDSYAEWNYGEASPLESHSSDTLGQCWDWLLAGADRDIESAPPAIRFAISTMQNWVQIKAGFAFPLRSNALIDLDDYETRLMTFLETGYRTIKIKVCPDSFGRCRELISNGQKRCSDLSFRVDANGSFDSSLAKEMSRALRGLPVDYVEDPCELSPEVLSIFHENGISVASDCGAFIGADVSILKPTVLGGAVPPKGHRLVFTTSFETEIGRAAVAWMAARYARNEIHGLSTGNLFSENYWPDCSEFSGRIQFAPGWDSWICSLEWRDV